MNGTDNGRVGSKGPLQEQPFHERGAALLAGPNTPTISDPALSAWERAKGVNFRDLASVSSIIQPGRVYRSSQVVSAQELEQLGVSAVLDLRQPPVLCKTNHHNVRRSLKQSCLSCLSWLGEHLGTSRLLPAAAFHSLRGRRDPADPLQQPLTQAMSRPLPCHRCTADCCQHYGIRARVFHVDLLPRRVSLHILKELPGHIQLKVLWAALRRKHPEPIVAGAVADPQVMGYLKLYHILLERAQPHIAEAVRLLADPGNLPLIMHCIHGKDRTGLVAMLLLLLCGVPREAVVSDYALSEVLLRESREKRELLGLQQHLTTDQVMAAARHVMSSTIDHIQFKYGSAAGYLRHLTDGELTAIVDNLTDPHLPLAPAEHSGPSCRELSRDSALEDGEVVLAGSGNGSGGGRGRGSGGDGGRVMVGSSSDNSIGSSRRRR